MTFDSRVSGMLVQEELRQQLKVCLHGRSGSVAFILASNHHHARLVCARKFSTNVSLAALGITS